MKKRKELTFILFTLIFGVLIFSSFAQAVVNEQTQIPKTKNWLKYKCMGTGTNWQSLTFEQHVFCFLALKDELTQRKENQSITYFIARSENNKGIHWANSYETALAKLVLDKSSLVESTLTNEWLLNQTESYSDVNWYLQVSTQDEENDVRCLMTYDNIQDNNEIEFNASGMPIKIGSNLQSCFEKQDYWLKLKDPRECAKKQFNITCTKDVVSSFFFKKGDAWYITTDFVSAASGETSELRIRSSCIANSQGCDYRATLWTAFAFANENPDVAKSFIPYLIMEKEANEKLLPEAFLYKIAGKEEYANEIGKLQGIDGLILASGSVNSNKYYDSAVAKLTGSVIDGKTNITKLKDKLLLLQKKEGTYYYWATSTSGGAGKDDLLDTAILYLSFWVGYDPNAQNECASNGFTCVDNCILAGGVSPSQIFDCGTTSNECCDISQNSYSCVEKYGECTIGTSCPSDKKLMNYQCKQGICCKNTSRLSCVSELRGTACIIDPLKEVECIKNNIIVPFIRTGDTQYCCEIGGVCTFRNKSCSLLAGEVCLPSEGKSCTGNNLLPAIEQFCCRQGACVQGQLTCAQKAGIKCNTGEECSQGTMVDASDTNGQMTCCTSGGRCLQSTCSETICNDGETCDASGYETMDALICCPGTCSAELQNCVDMGGQECFNDLVCSQSNIEAKDTTKCCIGTCKEKGTFPWGTVIIIIVILGLIALVYWLFKSGKIKMKGKGKEEDEFGFGNDSVDAGISGIEGFDKMPASGKPSKQQFKPLPGPILKQVPRMQAPSKPVQAQPKSSPTAKKPVKKTSSPLDENLAELEKLSKE